MRWGCEVDKNRFVDLSSIKEDMMSDIKKRVNKEFNEKNIKRLRKSIEFEISYNYEEIINKYTKRINEDEEWM